MLMQGLFSRIEGEIRRFSTQFGLGLAKAPRLSV